MSLIPCYLRQRAILLTDGYSYSGGKGDIQVFNPYVEYDDEYSTSQVSLKHGAYYDYECVESGWAVSTHLTLSSIPLNSMFTNVKYQYPLKVMISKLWLFSHRYSHKQIILTNPFSVSVCCP